MAIAAKEVNEAVQIMLAVFPINIELPEFELTLTSHAVQFGNSVFAVGDGNFQKGSQCMYWCSTSQPNASDWQSP